MNDSREKNANGYARPASQSNGPDPSSGANQGTRDGGTGQARGQANAHQCLEFCPICRVADILRASAPPELREQWQTVQREALLSTRAMIEHYLTRLDEEPEPRSSQVEDIPIL